MKLKKLFAAILCSCLLAGCKTTIRMGTAPVGGVYNAFGQLLADQMNQTDDHYRITVKETAGSGANIRLLSEGYIRIGIAQADVINESYYADLNGGEALKGYGAVTALYTESIQIAVKKESDITSVEQLEGKKVSVGQQESGSVRNAKQILNVYGLSDGMVMTFNYDYEDAYEHLIAGDIDAMFITSGAPSKIYQEHSDEIRILSLDTEQKNRLLNHYPYFTDVTIPAGTYDGQTTPIETVGIESILLASDQAPAASVKEMLETYFANVESYSAQMNIEFINNPQVSVDDITIPFHEGARQYYVEQGIMEDEGR